MHGPRACIWGFQTLPVYGFSPQSHTRTASGKPNTCTPLVHVLGEGSREAGSEISPTRGGGFRLLEKEGSSYGSAYTSLAVAMFSKKSSMYITQVVGRILVMTWAAFRSHAGMQSGQPRRA